MTQSPQSFRRASELIAQAGQAVREARYLDAAELFRTCVEIDSSNVDAKVGLGVSLMKARRITAANEAFNEAIRGGLDINTLLGIVRVLIDEVQWHMADVLLSLILKQVPNHLRARLYYGELSELRGNIDAARGIYSAILRDAPAASDVIVRYMGLASLEEGRRVLETAVQQAPEKSIERVHFRSLLASQAERIGRAGQDLPRSAVNAIDDLRPLYSLRELEAYRDDAMRCVESQNQPHAALEHVACAQYALGRTGEASATFTRLHQMNAPGIAGIVNLEPRFYEALDRIQADAVAAELPPVDWIASPTSVAGPTYFIAADPAYLKDYGRPMLRSIAANVPEALVHVHLMNPSDADVALFHAWAKDLGTLRVFFSRERVSLSPVTREAALYYHAVRFVRFFQLFERYRVPMTLMDVDGLVNRDFHRAVAALGEFDFALWAPPAVFAPWSTFAAGIVTARPTARGLRFMKLVAAVIAHHYKTSTLRWGLDQLALRCCYDFLVAAGDAPAFAPLPETVFARYADPAAAVWMQAGKKKRFARLLAASPEIDTGDLYIAALRRYGDA